MPCSLELMRSSSIALRSPFRLCRCVYTNDQDPQSTGLSERSGPFCPRWTHSSEGSTNMPILRLTQHSLAHFAWVVP